MAIRTKAQLQADIDADITTNGTGDITGAELNTLLNNIKDSYEDFIVEMNTAARDLLTPFDTLTIFNTDLERNQFYYNATWNTIASTNNIATELVLKGGANTDLNNEENGDWKIKSIGENLEFQRRESGTFNEKFNMTP